MYLQRLYLCSLCYFYAFSEDREDLHSLIFLWYTVVIDRQKIPGKKPENGEVGPANNGENYGISGKRRDHCERKEYGGKRK